MTKTKQERQHDSAEALSRQQRLEQHEAERYADQQREAESILAGFAYITNPTQFEQDVIAVLRALWARGA